MSEGFEELGGIKEILSASPNRDVYRRDINRKVRVKGIWWGRGAQKSAAYRTVIPMTMYVREDVLDKGYVDIEVKCLNGSNTSWGVCTIDSEEYKRLESVLGPRTDICCNQHNWDEYD